MPDNAVPAVKVRVDRRRRGLRSAVSRLKALRDQVGDRPVAPAGDQRWQWLDGCPDTGRAVVIGGRKAERTAAALARLRPGITVHLLGRSVEPATTMPPAVRHAHCPEIGDRVEFLIRTPAPGLIVEHRGKNRNDPTAGLRELFLFLPPGGSYVIEGMRPDTAPPGVQAPPGGSWLATAMALRPTPRPPDAADAELRAWLLRLTGGRLEVPDSDAEELSGLEREVADSIAAITFGDGWVSVRKRFVHRVKVREQQANDVLSKRLGPGWGRVLDRRAGTRFRSRARAFTHGEGQHHGLRYRDPIRVPDRHVREYRNALCLPRQRLIVGDVYAPDTFRHPLQGRLNHRTLVDSSRSEVRSLVHGRAAAPEPDDVVELAGSYFYFDTEYPGHFGHIMTEVISRHWGWEITCRQNREVRPLVSLGGEEESIPEYQRILFNALGVPTDEIAYIRPGTAARVESLIAATPAFAQPIYAAPDLLDTWEELARRLFLPEPTPELIFVSRRPGTKRTCTNTAEVEEAFAEFGFEVVYPEDHPLAMQATMFRQAKVIAGFGGSGMFSTIFAPGATRIVLNGTGYVGVNEYLIAAVNGGDVHYVWGPSEVTHAPDRWTWEANRSNFSIDIARHGGTIAEIVRASAR